MSYDLYLQFDSYVYLRNQCKLIKLHWTIYSLAFESMITSKYECWIDTYQLRRVLCRQSGQDFCLTLWNRSCSKPIVLAWRHLNFSFTFPEHIGKCKATGAYVAYNEAVKQQTFYRDNHSNLDGQFGEGREGKKIVKEKILIKKQLFQGSKGMLHLKQECLQLLLDSWKNWLHISTSK